MNQIDCKQAQNVWSRVMAAQANAQGTFANPPVQVKAAQEEQTASITPEQLLSSIEYEMLDAVTYQCLAAPPASPATPRLYDGSIRVSLPRATAMRPLRRSPGPEPARCGKSRSTSAATPRNSMSCSKAASERT